MPSGGRGNGGNSFTGRGGGGGRGGIGAARGFDDPQHSGFGGRGGAGRGGMGQSQATFPLTQSHFEPPAPHSGGRRRANSTHLAEFLIQDPSNHLFAVYQDSSAVVATTGRNRTMAERLRFEPRAPTQRSVHEEAYHGGRRDIEQLSQMASNGVDIGPELSKMRDFVSAQRQAVIQAHSETVADAFAGRAKAIEQDPTANYRTSVQSTVAGHAVGGWDEMDQTEVALARSKGRHHAINAAPVQQRQMLAEFSLLQAESSSYARAATASVAGSLNAYTDTVSAHPTGAGERKDSALGASVAGSPNAHMLRTRVTQAYERNYLSQSGPADRHIERILMSMRMTSNGFMAPSIPGQTNQALTGGNRSSMMAAGREQLKHHTEILRQYASGQHRQNFRASEPREN